VQVWLVSVPRLRLLPVYRQNKNIIRKLDHDFKILNRLRMTQTEELQMLQGIKSQLVASANRIANKIAELETAVQNSGNTTTEIDQALSDLKDEAQQIAGVVPDTTSNGTPVATGTGDSGTDNNAGTDLGNQG
jgi:methyl-accepting chemotaxis protein